MTQTRENRTLLFDFGGVVQRLLDDLLAHQLAQALGLSSDEFLPLFKEAVPRIQTGRLSERDFLLTLSRTRGVKLSRDPEYLFVLPFLESSHLYGEVTNVLDELIANNVMLALLSNTIPSHAKLNRRRGNYHWFGENVFLSCCIGLRKPDPQSFSYVARTMKRDLDSLILVDDDSDNVQAALGIGMGAILHASETTDVRQLRSKIRQFGIETN